MVNVISYCVGATITTITHPFGYAKILAQLGYEPLPPYQSRDLFGKTKWYYPNIFRYVGYIRKKDGFFGLYRGFVPQVIEGLIRSYVLQSVTDDLKLKFPISEECDDEDSPEILLFRNFGKKTALETTAKCIAVIFSHPFQVIALRSMAQFVGEETLYSNIFSSISEIYRNEGFSGFFVGIIPRLCGEIITIALINLVADIVNKFVFKSKENHSYVEILCSVIVSPVTFPFTVVSRIMCVNSSGLAIASRPHMVKYCGWTECWRHLSKLGQLKRGSTMFWRPSFETYTQQYSPSLLRTLSGRAIQTY